MEGVFTFHIIHFIKIKNWNKNHEPNKPLNTLLNTFTFNVLNISMHCILILKMSSLQVHQNFFLFATFCSSLLKTIRFYRVYLSCEREGRKPLSLTKKIGLCFCWEAKMLYGHLIEWFFPKNGSRGNQIKIMIIALI